MNEKVFTLFNKFVHKYGRLPTETDPDYLEMLRMSKYNILDVPDVSPGKCANCGASKNDGRKYADFGLHVDWYGQVFLCGLCLKDIAQAMGLFDEIKNTLATLVLNQENYVDLKHKGTELHEKMVQTLKEFEEFYVSIHSFKLESDSISIDSVDSDKTAGESEQHPIAEGLKLSSNRSEPRVTESNSSSGRKDIRSLTDLLRDPL